MMPVTFARFCHRGAPPFVVSPGAVSRFGLAPVHGDRHEFDLRFVGAATTSFELCNDYTTRGHTPRILETSRREARPKGRITLPPRAHRLAPVEGDGERCTHESRRLRLAALLFWERIGRETSSRGPSREGRGLAPARRCPEHLLVTDFVCVRLENARGSEIGRGFSHAMVAHCTAVLPALERVPRSDAPLVKSRGAFGTFGWREIRRSLFEGLLPPASVGVAGSC
jgi:hypothetical protein